MRKNISILLVLVLCVGLPLWGSRYNFPQTADKDFIIQELNKRLKIVDSNLVFDDKVLTITLPGAKGDKGDTGQAGQVGKNGKDGLPGLAIVGPVGDMPAHKWDGTRLRFQSPRGSWGPAIELRGLRGANGAKGQFGRNGKDGTNGDRGFNGENGTNGVDGVAGEKGEEGLPGIRGRDGLDGIDGVQGPPGPNGKNGEDAIMPKFTTLKVVTGVKLADNGKLVVTTQEVQIYLQ